MFDFDPRDRDDDRRDVEMPWIELGRAPGLDREQNDFRDRDEDLPDRNRDPRAFGKRSCIWHQSSARVPGHR
jgi:hypothetical protein